MQPRTLRFASPAPYRSPPRGRCEPFGTTFSISLSVLRWQATRTFPLLEPTRPVVKYQVILQGLAVPQRQAGPLDADGLEVHLERVMVNLGKLRAEDATVAGAMAKGEVEISVVVHAPDLESALARAQAVVRTALESVGGSVSKWSFDWTSAKATRIESLARATG